MDHVEPASKHLDYDLEDAATPLTDERIAELAKSYRETEDQYYFTKLSQELFPHLKGVILRVTSGDTDLLDDFNRVLLAVDRLVIRGTIDGRYPLEDGHVQKLPYIKKMAFRIASKSIKRLVKKRNKSKDIPLGQEIIEVIDKGKKTEASNPEKAIIGEEYGLQIKALEEKKEITIIQETKSTRDQLTKDIIFFRKIRKWSYKRIGKVVFPDLPLEKAATKAKDKFNNRKRTIFGNANIEAEAEAIQRGLEQGIDFEPIRERKKIKKKNKSQDED